MLTDLIAAKADEAPAILSTSGHANVWPTLEGKSVDPAKLSTLAFILKGTRPDAAGVVEYMKSFARVASDGEEGPWLDQLPADLVQGLAVLRDDQVPGVAKAWAATEEARREHWETTEVAVLLRELSAFAASAQAEGRDLLLWLCL